MSFDLALHNFGQEHEESRNARCEAQFDVFLSGLKMIDNIYFEWFLWINYDLSWIVFGYPCTWLGVFLTLLLVFFNIITAIAKYCVFPIILFLQIFFLLVNLGVCYFSCFPGSLACWSMCNYITNFIILGSWSSIRNHGIHQWGTSAEQPEEWKDACNWKAT